MLDVPATHKDKTQADTKFKVQRDRFLAFAFASSDLLFEVDHEGKIVFAMGAIQGLEGFKDTAIFNKDWLTLFANGDKAIVQELLKSIQVGQRKGPMVVHLHCANGTSKPALFSAFEMPDRPNIVYCSLSVASLRALEDYKATKNTITAEDHPIAISKPLSFQDKAIAAIKERQQSGSDTDLMLTLLDLSGNKENIAKVGKEKWDGFCNQVTNYLNSTSVGGDAASQIAAGKFGLLHDGILQNDEILQILQKLAANHDPALSGLSADLQSLDASEAPLDPEDLNKALQYTLKSFSTNGNIGNFDTLSQGFSQFMEENAGKISEFKTIILKEQFSFVYQPIIDLRNGQTEHFEVLIRFAKGGSPYDMIVFGEEVGLAVDLDFAVCNRVVRYLAEENLQKSISLAVNVSGASIINEVFLQKLHKLLDKHAPKLKGRLLFEVTESTKITNLEIAAKAIMELQTKGYPVCLDDFGAGSASFQYLQMLEVAHVKIDGAYDVLASERNAMMVKNLGQLCRDLKIGTIAERVETKEQMQKLMSLGINSAQGYYFSKPKPEPILLQTQLR